MKTLKFLTFLACVFSAASISMPTQAADCTAQVLSHSGNYPGTITYYGRITNNTGTPHTWYVLQTIIWGTDGGGGCVCNDTQISDCSPVTVPAWGSVDVQLSGTPPTGKTCAQYFVSAGVNTCLTADVICAAQSNCESIR